MDQSAAGTGSGGEMAMPPPTRSARSNVCIFGLSIMASHQIFHGNSSDPRIMRFFRREGRHVTRVKLSIHRQARGAIHCTIWVYL